METDQAGILRPDPTSCPSCGEPSLEPAGDGRWPRRVCGHCGSCWEATSAGEGGGRHAGMREVDSIACPGCTRRGVCESRPTWLAASLASNHTLKDGTKVLIRPLLYSDREQLAVRFHQLSHDSRRLRFLSAPEDLTDEDLEYLTNLDYHDHFALAAFAADEPGAPGIAVGRYIRTTGDPTVAEAAVTVMDRYQRRGLGTLLVRLLAEAAEPDGVTTFVAFVSWDNADALEALRRFGALITAEEPGIARVELDLTSSTARTAP
ncbi:MAG: GNAT family N-acetyltransferase [Acidimicrobiales bacterium]